MTGRGEGDLERILRQARRDLRIALLGLAIGVAASVVHFIVVLRSCRSECPGFSLALLVLYPVLWAIGTGSVLALARRSQKRGEGH
jgi:predicted lysophospholipase L1 biosynthesis ABC-type transport system permease subunit